MIAVFAIVVLKRNLQAYGSNPFPPNYAWLGQAYKGNGNYKKALELYQQAYWLADKTGYGEKQAYADEVANLKLQ
ncbi:MAG: hypothetical protein OQJ89_03445 [Kangiellaceae bacterium]|nr:hypothetical protein [Kangiellaceae bacterium]MCW8999928.1 hypothetical protein [Kangiellaceae bacterium]MCW9015992.1 hypothetical protein [Kangiellaceae bacterium]